MRRVKNFMNATDFPIVGQSFRLPSLTVPDQSMSMKEILDRFAKGLPVAGAKVPMFDDDGDEFPDLRTLDLAERQELVENYRLELQQLQAKEARTKADNEAKMAQKRARFEAIEKAYTDSLKKDSDESAH